MIDSFTKRYLAVLIATAVLAILSFSSISQLPLFYTNQFVYGPSVPAQLNTSLIESLSSGFTNSSWQNEVLNGSISNLSLTEKTFAPLKNSSTLMETTFDLFGIGSKNIYSNDPYIGPNYIAIERLMLGSYATGSSELLYADTVYQLVEGVAIASVYSLGIPAFNNTFLPIPSGLLPNSKGMDEFLIKPYQPGNAYLLKLELNDQVILYIATTLGKAFSCNLFSGAGYVESPTTGYNASQAAAGEAALLLRFSKGQAQSIGDLNPNLLGTGSLINQSRGPNPDSFAVIVPGWLLLSSQVGSRLFDIGVLNSNTTCKTTSYSRANGTLVAVNSTYQIKTEDLMHVLSLVQAYGSLVSAATYNTTPNRGIIAAIYQNGTLLLDVENVNLGLRNLTIMVNGKPVRARGMYAFVFTNVTLPYGENNVSISLANTTLTTQFYVDPPSLITNPVFRQHNLTFEMVNPSDRELNLSNVTVALYFLNSEGQPFNTASINPAPFTLTPDGGNYTITVPYASVGTGTLAIAKFRADTSEYASTPLKYYINGKVT